MTTPRLSPEDKRHIRSLAIHLQPGQGNPGILRRIIRAALNRQNQNTLASRATATAMMRLHSALGDVPIGAEENSEDPLAATNTASGGESLGPKLAQAKGLTQPALEDTAALVSARLTRLRRSTPVFLAVLDHQTASAAQNLPAANHAILPLNTTGS